ncbi:hypothetical protein SBRCBS47491_009158 [Sporothrix bragantina]|uniref:Alpha/beta hydrolase fold-3 domain-containing protein n=1 Tax=Sporothrix bragantina TaxID=671064 RepID=A0ABP0CUS7_9PEZI
MHPPPDTLALRERFHKVEFEAAAALGPCPDGVAQSYIDIELPALPNGAEAWTNRTVVVHPTKPSPSAPLIIMLYGGGFQCGTIDQVLLPARSCALRFGAVVACPSYHLCPEHQFPANVHSAYRAAAWVSDVNNLYKAVPGLQASGIVVDPVDAGFVITGISAGSNLAAVIAGVLAASPEKQAELLAGGLPLFKAPLTGVFLCIPFLTTEEVVPEKYRPLFKSRVENAEAAALPLTFVQRMTELYAANTRSPWFSPLALNDGTGANNFLPAKHASKVFLQVCSEDVLRDDAVIYQQWLEDAGGIDTQLVMMEGYGHSAWATQNLTSEEHRLGLKTKKLEGIAWLLGKEWDGNVDGVY